MMTKTKSKFGEFYTLHQGSDVLVLGNAWDAKSALLLQESGYQAIGTSSAAVAASLGYNDGEGMPFTDYLFVIKRITSSVQVPVTIDLEMGYGKNKETIFTNVQRLLELGVAGINLEDSIIAQGKRSLRDASEFAVTVSYIKERLIAIGQPLFLNIRCDTYLLKTDQARAESSRRSKIYESAGADGIFLPFISQEGDIQDAVSSTQLPVNVMCIPGLPGFEKLRVLGVKRASMGPFLQNKTYGGAGEVAASVLADGNFDGIL